MKGQTLLFFTERPVLIFMNHLFQGYQIKNKLPVLHALVIWLLIQQLDYAGAPLET